MAIFDELKKTLKGKRMQKRLDTVKNAYEEPDTEKESIIKATEIVIRLIEENPNMPAIDLLKRIQEEENLPNEILVQSAKLLPEIRSEKAAVKAVEELDLTSKGIQEILEYVDVSTDAAQKIVEQIPNEKIKEEEMEKIVEQRKREREEKRLKDIELKRKQTENYKKYLKEIYVKSDEKRTVELVSDLKMIIDENDSIELKNIVMQIFARKAAMEFKQVGSARISTIARAIPAEDLLKHNFSKLVGDEFEQIKDIDKYPGEKQYSEDLLQQQILTEIAKNIANSYKELGIIDIPQSEAMTQISKAQEIFLIDQIETYGVEIENREKLQRRIRGIKEYSEDDLINMFRKMDEDEKEEYVKELKMQMKLGKKKKFSQELEQKFIQLHDKMEGLNEEESIDVLNEAIDSIEEIEKERKAKEDEEEIMH